MPIREATHEDIRPVMKLGAWFLEQINPDLSVDETEAPRDLRFLIASKTGKLLVAEDQAKNLVGFLAGQIVKQAFVKCRFATDLAFVVKPGYPIHAVGLARHFIHWAKAQKGCKEVTLNISSGLSDVERLGALYEKLGLKKMGSCFTAYL